MTEANFDTQRQDYKVCNFSIPLGAAITMDGVSVHLAVASMFRTVPNTTGHIASTLIVAKMEKLLDIDVYKS